MKQQKTWKQRIMTGMIAGILCITGASVSLTSCRLWEQQNNVKEDVASTEKDAYDAKIVYYEAQIQTLTAQLGDMEQQLYALRADYMDQLQNLEEQLSAQLKPSAPSDELLPEVPKENEDGKNEQEEDPSQDAASDVVLCEYTYRVENNSAILTSYLGKEKDVVVPAAVDGYLVIGLGDSVFADCDVRSVTLPKTVESLGWFTFYQCENLEKVVLPAGISNIGYASFDGCSQSLCLYVIDGSYAEQYALSFGLNYQKQA
jgi:hypothetical protein